MAKVNCPSRGSNPQRGIGLERMSRLEFVPRTIEMDCILFMVWVTTSYVRLRYWVWCNGHVYFSSCRLVCPLRAKVTRKKSSGAREGECCGKKETISPHLWIPPFTIVITF